MRTIQRSMQPLFSSLQLSDDQQGLAHASDDSSKEPSKRSKGTILKVHMGQNNLFPLARVNVHNTNSGLDLAYKLLFSCGEKLTLD